MRRLSPGRQIVTYLLLILVALFVLLPIWGMLRLAFDGALKGAPVSFRIWPETFSYVTQEALMTGLPCLGFDLGGQGDALRAAGNGHVVALRNEVAVDTDALLTALRGLAEWPDGAAETGTDPARFPLWRRMAT